MLEKEKCSNKEQIESTITTTLRIPEFHYEKIKHLADFIGDSVNGTMLHLMFMGMKVYSGNVMIHPKNE